MMKSLLKKKNSSSSFLNPYFKRKQEFTLTELLIVISIIAILTGLLLPVLNKVRSAAYRIYCINNLRQLSLGIHLYRGDYGEYFHSANTANDTLSGKSPYIVSGTDIAAYAWWDQLTRLGYLPKNLKMFTCPVFVNHFGLNSLGWNNCYGAVYINMNSDPVKLYSLALDLPHIRKAGTSNVFLIGDACIATGMSMSRFLDSFTQTNYGPIAAFHNRKGNLLFIDGHVSSSRPVDINKTMYYISQDGGRWILRAPTNFYTGTPANPWSMTFPSRPYLYE